jgi:hypothetical protein
MNKRPLSGAGRTLRRRIWAFRLGTAAFVIGAIIALLVTLTGARELLTQLDAAPSDGRSELITMVLGFGLVLLGPVLMVALAVFTPSQWLPRVWERVGDSDGPKQPHAYR